MKDMVISKDITSFGTRIIPLGANNLTITSVNGGLDYIDDTLTKNVYGVKFTKNSDISKWYSEYFGKYAGIAGQYLFEYYRSF